MNLLEQFILQQSVYSRIQAELFRAQPKSETQEAKVELSLTPRLLSDQPADALPAYQLTANLDCKGNEGKSEDPIFHVRVTLEAIYKQVNGEPVSFDQFTSAHASLTRQVYPLLLQQMRALLAQLGLAQVQLPADLAANQVDRPEEPQTQIH